MMRGPCFVIATLLCVVSSAHNETSVCKPAPHWSVGDEEPMARSMGRVTVVALLQASCGFCLVQAANLGPLQNKLRTRGLRDISYIIVNDQSVMSKFLFPVLESSAPAGVSVYEQLPNQEDVWEILGGGKDDFLIYDRCGRLTFHIRLPLSYLYYPYVEAAINSTYYEDYCQNCSFYANVTHNITNKTFGNNSTDTKTEERSSPEVPCTDKDKSDKDKPGDHCKSDHNEEHDKQNLRNQQPREEEHHQPINKEEEQHQPINKEEEKH